MHRPAAPTAPHLFTPGTIPPGALGVLPASPGEAPANSPFVLFGAEASAGGTNGATGNAAAVDTVGEEAGAGASGAGRAEAWLGSYIFIYILIRIHIYIYISMSIFI